MSQISYERAVDLLEAEINDELVALEPSKGSCFGFNAVATTVWRKLETPKTFGELHRELIGLYDVEEDRCSAELKDLLDRMLAEGLIQAA